MFLAQTSQEDLVSSFLPGIVSLGGFGLFFLCLLFGYVVTKKSYDEIKQDRDEWKRLWQQEHELREKAQDALTVALEQGQATVHLLQSIETRAEQNRRSQ